MPRQELDRHCEHEKPEWTERKHTLLRRVVILSARRMRQVRGRLALIDGYAGPHTDGSDVSGSTAILTVAAAEMAKKGVPVKVYACEPDPDRFYHLVRNLEPMIRTGLLKAYNRAHSDALSSILPEIEGWPALVFLDPPGPEDLQLRLDLLPWLGRPATDVLGVFMSDAAARACTAAGRSEASEESRRTAEAILGPDWREASTESEACRLFKSQIGIHRKYTGFYPGLCTSLE